MNMIKTILTNYAERLDEYLSRLHHQPEGLAEVGFVGNGTDECPNKQARYDFIDRICEKRPTNNKFRNGWRNRIKDFKFD